LRRSDVGEERTRCAQVGASEFARCHIHESRAEGIVTAEDATVALRYGVDGVLVSNHGGRSEESLRSSIEALPEVIEAVGGKVPTMVDSRLTTWARENRPSDPSETILARTEVEQRHLVVAVFHVGQPAVIRVGVGGARLLKYLARGGLVSLAQQEAVDGCASYGRGAAARPDWLHEIKYDGYRLRVERNGDRVRLITRNGYDWTNRYPWIVEAALKNRQKQFIIDGEAVILGVDGIPADHRDHCPPVVKAAPTG
jgi:hypothetical protein